MHKTCNTYMCVYMYLLQAMSQLEDLEIECFGEFLKINILKKGINIDIYKNIIKDL